MSAVSAKSNPLAVETPSASPTLAAPSTPFPASSGTLPPIATPTISPPESTPPAQTTPLQPTPAPSTAPPAPVVGNGDPIISNIPSIISTDYFGKVTRSRDIPFNQFTITPGSGFTLGASAPPIVITALSSPLTGGITLAPKSGTIDLTGFNALDFSVENPTDSPLDIGILGSSKNSLTAPSSTTLSARYRMPPKSGKVHMLIYLVNEDSPYGVGGTCWRTLGVVGCPAGPKQVVAWNMGGNPNVALMTGLFFRVYSSKPLPTNGSVTVNSITALSIEYNAPELTGLVDKYGQNNYLTFENKVTSDSDLIADGKRDTAYFNNSKSTGALLPTQWDGYGGDSTQHVSPPTGYFSVKKLNNGKWWLVDPAGNLFFGTGINASYFESSATAIGSLSASKTGREGMFLGLPDRTGMNSKFFGKNNICYVSILYGSPTSQFCKTFMPQDSPPYFDTYNHYFSNLFIKYGEDPFNSNAQWRSNTLDRLREWGFNSDWSNAQGDGINGSGKLNYVYRLNLNNPLGSKIVVKQITGTAMPDVFNDDPLTGFRAVIRSNIVAQVNRSVRNKSVLLKQDDRLIGYSSDNELEWGHASTDPKVTYALILRILSFTDKDPSFKAKTTLIDALKFSAAYGGGNFAKLKSAWGFPNTFTTWEDLKAQPFIVSTKISAAFVQDLSFMFRVYANTYFSIVRSEIKSADPNHLFIGVNFASHPKEVVDACAQYCDALTWNYYDKTIDINKWAYIISKDRPVIITEFHFGHPNLNGRFSGGLINAANEDDRGAMYTQFISSILKIPQIVGYWHHGIVDDALTGDAGNFGGQSFGLIAITDRPYATMTDAVAKTNRSVYAVRNSASVSLPVISQFAASATQTTSGSPIILRWSTTGADSVMITSPSPTTFQNGNLVPDLGEVVPNDVTNSATRTLTVNPAVTSTYTLTAINSSGISQSSVTINVQ